MAICEICGSKKFKNIATRIREGIGKIIQCNKCGLVIQDLNWGTKQIRNYYEGAYQRTNSLIRGKTQSPEEHFEDRLKTVGEIYKQIKPLLTSKSKVLDVGSGPGALLSLIKPYVKRCVGIELHTPFVNFMKKKLSIEAYDEDINKLKINDKFDLVICISTLDHLPNPLETLFTMKKLLSKKGKIYVEVPNRNEALNLYLPDESRKKYNEFFWHRAHLFYFTEHTLSRLFRKAGLKSNIACRHDYTLKNFLNWYFLGKPQSGLVAGMRKNEFFKGNNPFEIKMNELFIGGEKCFKKIMSETFSGDSLCCTGWIENNR